MTSAPTSLLLLSLFVGCSESIVVKPLPPEERIEGTEPGDCSDSADNDADGLFDCDDDGCVGSPDCIGDDADSDADDTGPTDDANADADADADDTATSDDDADADDTATTDDDADADDTATTDDDADADDTATSDDADADDDPDGDGDGYPASEDCDDTDPSVYPGATEVCDGVDNDCDTEVDEGDSIPGSPTWYQDSDSDGYGGTSTRVSCDPPAGYVATSTDCDDGDSSIHPGATEVCDGIDNDCDTEVDEGCDAIDSDGDGWTPAEGDCDDGDSSIHPGATEVCDPFDVDENCNGVADDIDPTTDSTSMTTYYGDSDSDGYGGDSTWLSCDPPGGYVSTSTDCADGDASIHPGATEVCDGVDNDCDGTIDEGCDAIDSDGDGWTPAEGDCDDGDSSIHPGATEVCDPFDVDENCNGVADDTDPSTDSTSMTTYYGDSDSDGYGGSSTWLSCDPPGGYVSTSTDCADGDASVYPGAFEACDGVDNDCDGTIDEGCEPVEPSGCWTAAGYSLSTYTATESYDPEMHIVGAYYSHVGDTITVFNDNPGDIILVLNAYEPTNWIIENTGGGTVSQVAITGYNYASSTLSGSGAAGASVTRDYWAACAYGWPFTTGGCAEEGFVAEAEATFGTTLQSFRGCYASDAFYVE